MLLKKKCELTNENLWVINLPKKVDLTGQKFHHLLVLRDDGFRQGRKVYWYCKCDCGKEINVRADHLKEGRIKSCGCVQYTEQAFSSHHESNTRLYKIWCNMKSRVKDNPLYENIELCTEWHNYEVFRDWSIANGYAEELTIDRIDVYGDYEPTNCRWITIQEQQFNKTNNVNIEFNGRTQTLTEWAREKNINVNTLYARLNRLGWSIDRALTEQTENPKQPRLD